jgi:polysaccharide biosynthesis protein PslJ
MSFLGPSWCWVVRPDTIDFVKPRWNALGKYILAVATVAVCPLVVWAAIDRGELATFGLVGILALAIAVYIGLRHPLWLYWALAIVMGGLPFGYVPGVHVPLYLLFAAGMLLAALIHTTERRAISKLEVAVLLLILAAAVSVVATGISLIAILMFARWAIATLVVIALLRLSRENLARFGRFFVCAASANALVGIAMATVDQEQRLLKPLKIFGYGIGAGLRENTALYVYSDEGSTIGRTIRLGGTWVLPNSAGFALTTALVMCLILFRGWVRSALSAILLIALLLTLSRATIFSLAIGLLLVFIFHSMRARDRQIAMGVVGLVAAGALMTPMIRDRVLASFASDDKGRSDRVRALQAFPDQLSGHWVFGLGWARPEFLSGEAAQSTNYVSNAPLLTVYRGGVITGLIFIAVLVIGCVMGYRALRSSWLPNAVFGGVFVGLAVVYMNLAQSVVDMPVMALQFSILLAFMFYVDQSHNVPTVESQTREFNAQPAAGPPPRPIEVSTR